jgi:hypothetical protein
MGVQRMKINTLITDLCTGWKCMIILALRLLYTYRKIPSTGDWKGPTAGLDLMANREILYFSRKLNHCFPAELIICNIKVENLFK